MERITEKMLRARIDYLNKITGSPAKPYEVIDGKMIGQIGNFHLYCAYGSYGLHRMVNEGGGVSGSYIYGLHSKRELFNQICGLCRGFELAKEREA